MRCLPRVLSLGILLTMAIPASVAMASDGWCDTDPILVIQTPAGRPVPVYVDVGAQSLLVSPNTLLGSIVLSYTAVPTRDAEATSVTAVIRVPPSALEPSFATRNIISTGAFGTGTIYAYAPGRSGNPTALTFSLPYR